MILRNNNDLYNLIQEKIKDKNENNFADIIYYPDKLKISIIPEIPLSENDKRYLFLHVFTYIGNKRLQGIYKDILIIQ